MDHSDDAKRYSTRLTINRPVPLEVREWLRNCEKIIDHEINTPEFCAQMDVMEEAERRRMIYGSSAVLVKNDGWELVDEFVDYKKK